MFSCGRILDELKRLSKEDHKEDHKEGNIILIDFNKTMRNAEMVRSSFPIASIVALNRPTDYSYYETRNGLQILCLLKNDNEIIFVTVGKNLRVLDKITAVPTIGQLLHVKGNDAVKGHYITLQLKRYLNVVSNKSRNRATRNANTHRTM